MSRPLLLPIVHRVNTVAHLRRIPPAWGVEVDLRDSGRHLVLNHEPLKGGERLEEYLRQFRHRFIILNIKSEGIEQAVIRAVQRRRIRHYCLLDVTIPKLVALGRQGVQHLAARYSEFESLESCLALARWTEWVWIDCFTKIPLTPVIARRLRTTFKLCLCSPELEGHPRAAVLRMKRQVQGLPLDAVCTDHPALWMGTRC